MDMNRLKKFMFRFLIVNLVYFSVKLTIDFNGPIDLFDSTSLFYYASAFFLIMSTWEVNDWFIKREQRRQNNQYLSYKNNLRVLLLSFVVMTPIVALVYYIGIFELSEFVRAHYDSRWLQWRIDVLRGMLLGFAITVFNQFYHSVRQRSQLEKKVEVLQKEAITSRYKSLKSQISPHFLFNSLNTLTSLMYEDRDLASDFVSRLSSCYRYILDNREEDLVSLQKELSFLDSFMFMMNIRHEEALIMKTDFDINPTEYLIPTLTLQMLVENALKHNYYSKEKPMTIEVVNKGTQRLVVRNTYRKRELEEESTGLGIQNIKKRYSFYTNQEVLVEEGKEQFSIEVPLLPKNIKEVTLLQIS